MKRSQFMNEKLKPFGLLCLILSLVGCASQPRPEVARQLSLVKDLDVQGHRGCRGLMPENTIPGFIKALGLGVTTLEMDVVITKDKQVLLSHEPYLSSKICYAPDGGKIKEKNEKDYNLYQMTYDQIKTCDCGSKPMVGFPDQQKLAVAKPLLTDVIDAVEDYLKAHELPPVRYNIETKTNPDGDGIFHPEPKAFVDLVMQVVNEKKIAERVIIQSFDVRTLQYMHEAFPKVKLALLVANKEVPEANIEDLGFFPAIYSPYYLLVNESLIEYAHEHNMKVIPWTVNKAAEIRKILALGVDGVITDFPDRVFEVLTE